MAELLENYSVHNANDNFLSVSYFYAFPKEETCLIIQTAGHKPERKYTLRKWILKLFFIYIRKVLEI